MDSITKNYVEKIRQLCKERGIKISKLEKDLGFGNGYLNSKKVATIKTDRLMKILDYIGISPLEFYKYINGEEDKKITATESDGEEDKLKFLYDGFNELSPEDKEKFVTTLLKHLMHNQ